MTEIKPIETRFAGYRFRSRLEARYAVFFTALPIEWQYEIEGFDLGDAGLYLPDFWFPQVKMWGEVKAIEPTAEEDAKMQALVRVTGFPCLRLIGLPDDHPYEAWELGPDRFAPLWRMDYCLTNYHEYPAKEGRFYCCPGNDEDGHWDDTLQAALAARAARFEYGEHGEQTA